jgi:hypothetical protein
MVPVEDSITLRRVQGAIPSPAVSESPACALDA